MNLRVEEVEAADDTHRQKNSFRVHYVKKCQRDKSRGELRGMPRRVPSEMVEKE